MFQIREQKCREVIGFAQGHTTCGRQGTEASVPCLSSLLQKQVGPVLRWIIRRAGMGSQQAKPKEALALSNCSVDESSRHACWASYRRHQKDTTMQTSCSIEALGFLSIKRVRKISF